MKIRVKFLILAVCGFLMIHAGKETYACVTKEKMVHNVITSGDVSIGIREWADPEKTIPYPDGVRDGITPGTSVTKVAEVWNEGEKPAFIRAELLVSIGGEKEVPYEEQGLLTLSISDDWMMGDDGNYYYDGILEPGAVTEPLFTKVSFSDTMDSRLQGKKAAVHVRVAAVQSEHNGSGVMEAAGWPSWN